MRPRWQKAASFAARYHTNQFRSDRETPYVAHPFRVAMTLVNVFGVNDDSLICAALLHDVIEDTRCSYDVLCQEFGADVADLVIALTKDMRSPQPRRDNHYYDKLGRAEWRVRLIKLADAYDNLCDAADLPEESREVTIQKNLRKVEHVLRAAGNDSRLGTSVKILRDLADDVSR